MLKTVAIFTNSEKRRWYRIDVGTDLFDSVVIRRWGAVGTGHGSDSITVISSQEEEARVVAAETKRRLARGYQCVQLKP